MSIHDMSQGQTCCVLSLALVQIMSIENSLLAFPIIQSKQAEGQCWLKTCAAWPRELGDSCTAVNHTADATSKGP